MADTEEHSIVWPDRDVELSDGRVVTVREVRAGEEDRHHDDVMPIRQAVRELIGHARDRDVVAEAFYRILEDHAPALSRLTRLCADLDEETWGALRTVDADTLRLTWLGVHLGPFAHRHILVQTMTGAVVGSGGSSSPGPSSEPDTPETPAT